MHKILEQRRSSWGKNWPWTLPFSLQTSWFLDHWTAQTQLHALSLPWSQLPVSSSQWAQLTGIIFFDALHFTCRGYSLPHEVACNTLLLVSFSGQLRTARSMTQTPTVLKDLLLLHSKRLLCNGRLDGKLTAGYWGHAEEKEEGMRCFIVCVWRKWILRYLEQICKCCPFRQFWSSSSFWWFTSLFCMLRNHNDNAVQQS